MNERERLLKQLEQTSAALAETQGKLEVAEGNLKVAKSVLEDWGQHKDTEHWDAEKSTYRIKTQEQWDEEVKKLEMDVKELKKYAKKLEMWKEQREKQAAIVGTPGNSIFNSRPNTSRRYYILLI